MSSFAADFANSYKDKEQSVWFFVTIIGLTIVWLPIIISALISGIKYIFALFLLITPCLCFFIFGLVKKQYLTLSVISKILFECLVVGYPLYHVRGL